MNAPTLFRPAQSITPACHRRRARRANGAVKAMTGLIICCLFGMGAVVGNAADANKKKSGSAPPPADNLPDWKPLFDGKSLAGWKVTDFAGHGEITINPKFKGPADTNSAPALIIEMGAILSGVTWTNDPPKGEYELTLDAMKLDGSDFFCALTFPAADSHCSLIVGGWGGSVVGISSVDGMDASENETSKFLSFDKNRWYRISLRVTKAKIEAWIDTDKVIDLVTTDRRISIRAGEIELAEPFGLSVYQTKAAYRNFKIRSL